MSRNEIEVLQGFIESIDIMIEFHEPPWEIAPRFSSWIVKVRTSLELMSNYPNLMEAWSEGLTGTQFSPEDSSLSTAMLEAKALLNSIIMQLQTGHEFEELVSIDSFENTRSYYMILVRQINGCYTNGWYDASAVMLRKLFESLLIDCFKANQIEDLARDENGHYLSLDKLIDKFLSISQNDKRLSLPRNVYKYLPKLKELKRIGDSAAHDYYYYTKRQDLERFHEAIRLIVDALVYSAKLT